MKQINQLMNRLRFIVFAILFFSPKLYAENYVDNISGISNLAESTVKAAALQMDTDTNKVLENLNNELQNLSSSNDNIEIISLIIDINSNHLR